MRYVGVLFLHIQEAFESRSRVVIWLIMSLFNPLIMIFFWKGAHTNSSSISFTFIATYYILFILLSTILMAHVETSVAYEDIKEGELTQFLLKPFSYFWRKFLMETSYRLVQGLFGLIVFIILFVAFREYILLSSSPIIILFSFIVTILGYLICFTYKMVVGLSSFWFTEPGGILEVSDILGFLLGGYIIPVLFLPKILENISYFLPFSYFIYFPTISFEGKLSLLQIIGVICIQLLWLGIFLLLYRFLFRLGIKKYSGVGQ